MEIVKFEKLESKLVSINNRVVLLDKDVALLYGIEAKKLRQQLKRNIEKFPEDYAFQLSKEELDTMVSQNVTPSKQEFWRKPSICLYRERSLYGCYYT